MPFDSRVGINLRRARNSGHHAIGIIRRDADTEVDPRPDGINPMGHHVATNDPVTGVRWCVADLHEAASALTEPGARCDNIRDIYSSVSSATLELTTRIGNRLVGR